MGRFQGFYTGGNIAEDDTNLLGTQRIAKRKQKKKSSYVWRIDFEKCHTKEDFERIIETLPSYIKRKSGIFIFSDSANSTYEDMISLGEDRFVNVKSGLNFYCVSDFPELLQSFSVETGDNLVYIKFKNFDTSKYESFGWMFSQCSRLQYIDISMLSCQNVTEIDEMFRGCMSLREIDMHGVDLSKAIGCNTFEGCDNLSCINMRGCNGTSVNLIRNLLSNWDLENQVKIVGEALQIEEENNYSNQESSHTTSEKPRSSIAGPVENPTVNKFKKTDPYLAFRILGTIITFLACGFLVVNFGEDMPGLIKGLLIISGPALIKWIWDKN